MLLTSCYVTFRMQKCSSERSRVGVVSLAVVSKFSKEQIEVNFTPNIPTVLILKNSVQLHLCILDYLT